eukprot:CAMPEP_0118934532 /NCGR_PEP_ID=MMETSP1169-20130426/13879_1 /TAXON_ID=36882 /ORGANISM="Pyramimonas obovata, Strain CCMP722" /LENGTH=123 /DNA_ID=CAMNT_0006877447 /DNA_START=432 /DNA_END=800 /DNA_ORIENTATION=+
MGCGASRVPTSSTLPYEGPSMAASHEAVASTSGASQGHPKRSGSAHRHKSEPTAHPGVPAVGSSALQALGQQAARHSRASTSSSSTEASTHRWSLDGRRASEDSKGCRLNESADSKASDDEAY